MIHKPGLIADPVPGVANGGRHAPGKRHSFLKAGDPDCALKINDCGYLVLEMASGTGPDERRRVDRVSICAKNKGSPRVGVRETDVNCGCLMPARIAENGDAAASGCKILHYGDRVVVTAAIDNKYLQFLERVAVLEQTLQALFDMRAFVVSWNDDGDERFKVSHH